MISKEILIEYLYYIFGVEFRYYYSTDNYIVYFIYNMSMIGYNTEEDNWSGVVDNEIIRFYEDLMSIDMKVWIRKRKLEKI
jgi:hypothetical protein